MPLYHRHLIGKDHSLARPASLVYSISYVTHFEHTHLLHKGKDHCTADLLFHWFGFDKLVNLYLIQNKQSS